MRKIEQTSATQILKDTDTHTRVSLDSRYSVDEYEFMNRSFNRSMNKWANYFLEYTPIRTSARRWAVGIVARNNQR